MKPSYVTAVLAATLASPAAAAPRFATLATNEMALVCEHASDLLAVLSAARASEGEPAGTAAYRATGVLNTQIKSGECWVLWPGRTALTPISPESQRRPNEISPEIIHLYLQGDAEFYGLKRQWQPMTEQ